MNFVNMYSQNKEEKVILEYFGDWVGKVTDIGANDGITFSNSAKLIENGWAGDLIEPSPSALERLKERYDGVERVRIYPVAIGPEKKKIVLHESDEHHGDNIALLSTTIPEEMKRWRGTQVFTPVEVQQCRWADLEIVVGDFVSIDAEGMDFQILKQIPLELVSMVCVEWNNNARELAKIGAVCRAYNMREIHRNFENVIFAK